MYSFDRYGNKRWEIAINSKNDGVLTGVAIDPMTEDINDDIRKPKAWVFSTPRKKYPIDRKNLMDDDTGVKFNSPKAKVDAWSPKGKNSLQ